MSETASRAPLQDLMVAMDVVDTLRHNKKLVARELDSEGRRQRLIARLREIYTTQGIEVTEAMLEEGVRALEEDRFGYSPPQKSFSTLLAYVYIKRSSWGKPLMLLVLISLVALSLYYFAVVRPDSIIEKQLPTQLHQSYSEFKAISKDDGANQQAQKLLAAAQTALKSGKQEEALTYYEQLNSLLTTLKKSYTLKIVNEHGKRSGIWTIPAINKEARNYYLIIHAVTNNGTVLQMVIANEETDEVKQVTRWGLRVDKSIFSIVEADKRDDGIIQKNIVGTKKRGFLEPQYSITTTGGTITEW